MKTAILFIMLAAAVSHAQGETPQFSLSDFNADFNKIQKTGMMVFGSWAALNFAGNGIPLMLGSNEIVDGTIRSFMIMNIGWNVINGALAGTGYFTCCRKDPAEIDLAGTVKRQYTAEKTFLFNSGLDVGYIGFGLFLTELSERSANPELVEGFGYSLILQGAALLVFDVAMQVVHAGHRKKLDSHLSLR